MLNNHIIATAYNNIAIAYNKSGQQPKARWALEISAKLHKTAYGADSNELATIYKNLASITEHYGFAISYYKKAYKIKSKIFGETNIETLNIQVNIAWIYYEMGFCDKAIAVYKTILETLRHDCDEENVHVVQIRKSIEQAEDCKRNQNKPNQPPLGWDDELTSVSSFHEIGMEGRREETSVKVLHTVEKWDKKT